MPLTGKTTRRAVPRYPRPIFDRANAHDLVVGLIRHVRHPPCDTCRSPRRVALETIRSPPPSEYRLRELWALLVGEVNIAKVHNCGQQPEPEVGREQHIRLGADHAVALLSWLPQDRAVVAPPDP